jgi:nitroreductase
VTGTGQSPGFDRVLASRRMCRDYLDRPVDAELLDGVLRAAFRGPSAGNTDALDLVVLVGREQVARYWDTTLPESRRGGFPWPGLLRAPVLVLPYVSPRAYVERYGEADKSGTGLGIDADRWAVPYWWVDGGAAVMALLLAAEAAGLGALLFGQFDHEPALAALLGVPEGRRALGTIALGHRGDGDRRSASAGRGRPDPAVRVHHGAWSAPTGPDAP